MLDRLLGELLSAVLGLLVIALLAHALESVIPVLITFLIMLWLLRVLVERRN